MMIEPLGHRAVLKLLDEEQKRSPGGIVLPDSTTSEKAVRAKVVAVGKDAKPELKVGDVVLVLRHAGAEFEGGKEKLVLIKAADVLAVVEEK